MILKIIITEKKERDLNQFSLVIKFTDNYGNYV